MNKKCTKCHELKPVTEYYKNAAAGDGLTHRCKTCIYKKRPPRKKSPTLLCSMCKVRYPREVMAKSSRRCRPCDTSRRHTRRGAEANGTVLRLIRLLMPACVKCGASENLQYDHINPIALGGNGHWTNYQTLCATCNNRKNAKHADYRPHKWTQLVWTPYERNETVN